MASDPEDIILSSCFFITIFLMKKSLKAREKGTFFSLKKSLWLN
jgi:hypothetical protein